MEYSKVVLFSDLDGTLFDDEKKVPERNRAAIHRFCQAGGIFCISSGRIQSNIQRYIGDIPVNGPCILYNGSAVYDWKKGEFLYKQTLDMEAAEVFMTRILNDFSDVGVQVYPGKDICFVSPEETADREFVELHRPCLFQTLETVEKPWLKVLIQGRPERLDEIRRLGEAVPDIGTFVSTKADYLEILPQGVSKGTALDIALGLPELKGRVAVAAGDFYNDIELLEHADVGVAPADALEEVKRVADYVACDNNHGVIADCIEHIIPRIK